MEFGWVNIDDRERRMISSLVDSYSQEQARDWLGTEVVSNAIADSLFPATTTLLRRHARYFYLVPYVAKALEGKNRKYIKPSDVRDALKDEERRLALILKESSAQNDSHEDGIIGTDSFDKGGWVQQPPNAIYWSSLQRLGFLNDPDMSRTDYFRAFMKNAEAVKDRQRSRRKDYVEGESDDMLPGSSFWTVSGSLYSRWKAEELDRRDVSIHLTKPEAEDLKRRITTRCTGTLYAELLSNPDLFSAAQGASFDDLAMRVQEGFEGKLPEDMIQRVSTAANFSKFAFGCIVRYNVLLGSANGASEDTWEECNQEFFQAAKLLDTDELDALFGIHESRNWGGSKRFLEDAKAAAISGDVSQLDEVIKQREISVKTGKSNFSLKEVPDQPVAQFRYNFRFPIAMNIAADIIDTLHED